MRWIAWLACTRLAVLGAAEVLVAATGVECVCVTVSRSEITCGCRSAIVREAGQIRVCWGVDASGVRGWYELFGVVGFGLYWG